MRRALLVLTLSLGLASPASAAPQEVVGKDDLTFTPAHVAVKPGEPVTWRFDGTAQAHNVAYHAPSAADPAWTSFRTEPAINAPPASFTFTTDGVYSFICTVHPDTMSGTVTVGENAVPQGATVPAGQQHLVNDDGTPVTVERVTEDKAKPRLSAVSVRRSGGGAVRVRLRVSEEADVEVRLKRGSRTVKTTTAHGTGTRSVTLRGLRAGRYRVEVRATDIAGNRSTLERSTITVR